MLEDCERSVIFSSVSTQPSVFVFTSVSSVEPRGSLRTVFKVDDVPTDGCCVDT